MESGEQTARDLLTELMEAQDVSQRQLAMAAHVSPSHVSRVRHRQKEPSQQLLRALDRALGAGGVLVAAWEAEWEKSNVDTTRRGFVALAAAAIPAATPALRPSPATVAHLRRVLLANKRSACLTQPSRMIPTITQHVEALRRLRADAAPDVARDLLDLAAHNASLLSSLHQDNLNGPQAWAWTDRAAEWAQSAGNWTLSAHMCNRRASIAWWQGDGRRALDCAAAVEHAPWPLPAALRADAAQQQARAYSILGDEVSCRRWIDEWARRAQQGVGEPLPEFIAMSTYSASYVDQLTAFCLAALGRGRAAVDLLDRDTAGQHARWGHLMLARTAAAQAVAEEPERAAATALAALEPAQLVGSGRTVAELRGLHRQLATRWPDASGVALLGEQLAVPA